MDVFQVMQSYDALRTSAIELHFKLIDLWYYDFLSNRRWWVNLGILIIPWIVWIYLRKKESTDRLLYGGIVAIGITSTLDGIGVEYGLWNYHYNVDPLIPPFLPFDLSLFPVAIMLSLQYKPKFNPIIKAIIFSLIISFIIQPIAVKLLIFNPKLFKTFYFVPIHIIVYLIIYYVTYKRSNFESLTK